MVDYDIRVRDAARIIFKKNFSNETYTITNEFDPRREERQASLKKIKFFWFGNDEIADNVFRGVSFS